MKEEQVVPGLGFWFLRSIIVLFHSIHFIIPPPLLRQNFGFIGTAQHFLSRTTQQQQQGRYKRPQSA